jgi:MATE family multidrug resistance protein
MNQSGNTDQSAHRRILAIALPAILANSSTPLVGLVDTWAIGHLPNAVHLAAVGLGSVVFNYLFWAFGFLRMGTTGLVAQAWGRGDTSSLQAEVVRGAAISLGLGLLLLALQGPILGIALRAMLPPDEVATLTAEYFNIRIWAAPGTLLTFAMAGVLFGLGRTGGVLAIHLVLNITNGVLNVWFVVGLGLGVAGIALGTLIAQWLAAVISVWIVLRVLGARPVLQAVADATTWAMSRFGRLVVINGFIFIRTIFLMTALAIIMRVAGRLGSTDMAASHVINQYMMLVALGLDGFAHAAEALAGKAWGEGRREGFQRWVRLTGAWAVLASIVYTLLFWGLGNPLTALLTDIQPVRDAVATLMPLVAALPVVAVWCYHFDGVYIGATAAAAMMVTMGIAFVLYLLILDPMTAAWGLPGLWGAVLIFMAARGIAQAAWYPSLLRRLPA